MKVWPLLLVLGACTTIIEPIDANAPSILSTEALGELLPGKTLYIEVPPGGPGGPDGGIAPFYFGEDGAAAAKLPAGMTLVGTWRLEDGQYCVDWENGPKNSCSGISGTPSNYAIIDTSTGETRGAVAEIQSGNPENL